MESTFIATPAARAHAARRWDSAAFQLSGRFTDVVAPCSGTTMSPIAYAVSVPVAGITFVAPKNQDRPPRGVPR